MGSPLPLPVVSFLREHVRSLLQLEALLLVFEAGAQSRSSAELSREMFVPVQPLEAWLDEFATDGFCVHDEAGYRGPVDTATYELLAEVSDAYLRRPVSVARLVFGPGRSDIAQLADAFRLRPEE